MGTWVQQNMCWRGVFKREIRISRQGISYVIVVLLW